MIAFRDFVPDRIEAPKLFSLGRYEPFGEAVDRANAWIAAEAVDVLNVETVALPNIWLTHRAGSQGASLHAGESPVWFQFVRVWYRAKG